MNMPALLQRIPRLLRGGTAVGASGAAPDAATDDVVADEGDAVLGCGWFDSSHALLTGLMVSEHAANDAVAAALPLGAWLELQLGGFSAPRQPA